MTSILFEEIYSRFLLKTEAYDLFTPETSEEMRNELLCGYVHQATSDPFVRKQFSSIWISDPVLKKDETGKLRIDGMIECEMEYVIDEYEDKEFVLEMLSDGMVLAWIEPKVNSIKNITQFFSSNDTKFYAQSNHLSSLRSLREDMRLHRSKLISDRGFIHNKYLDGEISNIRGGS